MRYGRAVQRLEMIAERCQRVSGLWDEAPQLIGAYAFGHVLGPGQLDAVQVALVLNHPAEELTWCARPTSCSGKDRISAGVEERPGPARWTGWARRSWERSTPTAFRLPQQHVPRYETFDLLDERRLTAFLCREEPALGLKSLTGKLFTSIGAFLINLGAFLTNLEVVENELIPLSDLNEPFRRMAENFYRLLGQFRLT